MQQYGHISEFAKLSTTGSMVQYILQTKREGSNPFVSLFVVKEEQVHIDPHSSWW